jgi:hypothetical protein
VSSFPSATDAPKLLARTLQLAADSLEWPSQETRWEAFKCCHPFGTNHKIKIEVHEPTNLRRWWICDKTTKQCTILYVERDSILDKDITYDD